MLRDYHSKKKKKKKRDAVWHGFRGGCVHFVCFILYVLSKLGVLYLSCFLLLFFSLLFVIYFIHFVCFWHFVLFFSYVRIELGSSSLFLIVIYLFI